MIFFILLWLIIIVTRTLLVHTFFSLEEDTKLQFNMEPAEGKEGFNQVYDVF